MIMLNISARMSLSENTAAMRIRGLSCAHPGTACEAASAAPAFNTLRRSILNCMVFLLVYVLGLLGHRGGREPTQDHVGHHPAASAEVPLGAHGPLEDGAERELVGDVEHAERGDRHVGVDRIHVGT